MDVEVGSVIRELRRERGISLSKLALRINYSKSYLSRVESGLKPLTPEMARLIDHELGANGGILRLAPDGPAASSITPTAPDITTLMVGILGAPETNRMLRAAASDGSVENGLWELLGQVRALARRVSPWLVLPMLTAQTDAVEQLAKAAPSDASRRLFHIASRFAEYTGWMHQEANDITSAARWTVRARDLAASGDQVDVVQFCLVRRADIALNGYGTEQAIEMTESVLLDQRTSNRVRAMAALVKARAHALVGEANACELALEDAQQRLLADGAQHSPNALGFTGMLDPVTATRGWAWFALGKPVEASLLLRTALDEAAPTSVRTRTRLAVRAATAYAACEEPLAAAHIIREYASPIQAVGSAGIRDDLRQLIRIVSRWHWKPVATDLLQLLKPLVAGAVGTDLTGGDAERGPG